MEASTVDGGTLAGTEERLRALVVALAERNAQLEEALESRVLIEQAKGMLAERWGVAPDSAFGLLRGAARAHRMRVRDLALCVLVSRTTPPELEGVRPR